MTNRSSTIVRSRSEPTRDYFDGLRTLPVMYPLGYRALRKSVKDGLERTPCRSDIRR
jgi:hypothetical protein